MIISIYQTADVSGLARKLSGGRGLVVEVDANGRILGSLQSHKGHLVSISEVHQLPDRLFFGTPYEPYLGMLPLNDEAIKRLTSGGNSGDTPRSNSEKQEL